MMRVRNIPVEPESEDRQLVADFFGLKVTDVTIEPQPETFSVYLKGEKEAQTQYKKANPWGNTDIPKRYDFNDRLLVRWTGKSVKPA